MALTPIETIKGPTVKKKKNCTNCFWRYKDNEMQAYECRFNPPSAFPLMINHPLTNKPTQSSMSIYPPVSENHYCSHWRA